MAKKTKNILLTISISVLLLVGLLVWNNKQNNKENDATTVIDTSDNTGNVHDTANGEDVQESDDKEPEQTTLCFTQDYGDGQGVCLVDDQEYAIYFHLDRNMEHGYLACYYEYVFKCGENVIYRIELSDLVINGSEYIGKDTINGGFNAKEKETMRAIRESSKIDAYIYANGIHEIHSIKGTAQAVYYDEKRQGVKHEFEVDMPQEEELSYNLKPFMDAMALNQNLYSDDNMDINLIGLGDFNYNYDKLEGLIHVSNKSDEEQYFALGPCVINGVCIDTSALGSIGSIVKPGMEQFYYFSVNNGDIEKAGIESISSIGLMILNNNDDDTSISDGISMGGQLYNVELCKKGNGHNPGPEGELIYAGNDVSVYLKGKKTDNFVHELDLYAYVAICNNSEQNISFSYSDTKANGVNCKRGTFITWDDDGSYINGNTIDNLIPPGCIKNETIMFYGIENLTFPCTATCKLDFMSAGGGKILFRSDDIEFTFDSPPE